MSAPPEDALVHRAITAPGTPLYLLEPGPWWLALGGLAAALEGGDPAGALAAYAALFRALVAGGHADLAGAAAAALLWDEHPAARAAMSGRLPRGLERAFGRDLAVVQEVVACDWRERASRLAGDALPPLDALAPPPADPAEARDLDDLARALGELPTDTLLARLLERYRRDGAGPLARYRAFAWNGTDLVGIPDPDAGLVELVGLERQLERLAANTEDLVAGRPAQHALLYGPRGSGKSTAVRRLLGRYRESRLRLVEVAAHRLGDLPVLLARLGDRPHRYVLFVDDLSFEVDDASYHPLKTLLEGSLARRPDNVLVYATSNRRHLVRERFADRPDPLDDDVHAWDTQHERLALADRFGLVITFPDATQKRYLAIVEGLAGSAGVDRPDLAERALRFADWGNGYSGRTARQFIDLLLAERARR